MNTILTPQQIKDELTHLSFVLIEILGEVYKCPHERWVRTKLAPYLARRPWKYVLGPGDCEDARTSQEDDIRKAALKNPAWIGYDVPAAEINVTISSFNSLGLDQWGNHATEIIRVAEGYWLFCDRQNPNDLRDFRTLLPEEMGGDGSIVRCNSVRV